MNQMYTEIDVTRKAEEMFNNYKQLFNSENAMKLSLKEADYHIYNNPDSKFWPAVKKHLLKKSKEG